MKTFARFLSPWQHTAPNRSHAITLVKHFKDTGVNVPTPTATTWQRKFRKHCIHSTAFWWMAGRFLKLSAANSQNIWNKLILKSFKINYCSSLVEASPLYSVEEVTGRHVHHSLGWCLLQFHYITHQWASNPCWISEKTRPTGSWCKLQEYQMSSWKVVASYSFVTSYARKRSGKQVHNNMVIAHSTSLFLYINWVCPLIFLILQNVSFQFGLSEFLLKEFGEVQIDMVLKHVSTFGPNYTK